MRILIIRHGDPDYANDTLTEKGHREAQLLAEKLKKEKIDYIYSSPLGRARHTCNYTARALGKENEVVEKDWLREFGAPLTLPSGRERQIPWDMLPSEWVDIPQMYNKDEWYKQEYCQQGEMERRMRYVYDGLDELLASHGYVREGEVYRTKKGHSETIALFCHFGLEMLLLSRLCNISPIILWHHFVALPTSVTTLYTEERREGTAVFRCCGFGDTGHLLLGEEAPSFAARFCEVYGNGDRED
ncbi:MAG: histidine phosphatase family protein [Clostridia bacterium]|nr:histidine phosphatase family protein [Clostridia bacterium]